MSITTILNHVTDYKYNKMINLAAQTIRLRPSPHARASIQSYSLKITPSNHFINWQQDPFGNYLARINFNEKTDHFRVEVDLVTEVKVFNPFDFFLEESAKHYPFKYSHELKDELAPYLEVKDTSKELIKYVKSLNLKKRGTIDFLVDINRGLNEYLNYTIRLEPGVQTCTETLTLKSGSCRDMAWLLCQIFRHIGIASRFASGYLIQLTADQKAIDGPSGPEQDFTDLHAWTEVYLPGAGWVGLDPTSGLFAGEGHIPLCCTPSPSSAAPISGAIDPCESTMEHTMSITRVKEERRVTKPYSDDEWTEIDALGHQVDDDLNANDVRLTMGGEPTFVSIDDREGEEWHFSALSENKKRLGKEMLKRMQHKFAQGSMIHIGQGKWYPGEILPRWALTNYWRKDGEVMWSNPYHLADPDYNLGHTIYTAQNFLNALAEKLAIPSHYVQPAYEDASYYLWKEARIPIQNDIAISDLYEKTERQRLQSLLDNNLNNPVGYVLPLSFSPTRGRWISNGWNFASGKLILTIGDSPVGLRLPLGSLPNVGNYNEFIYERSPFSQNCLLPSRQMLESNLNNRGSTYDWDFINDANGLVKTALSVEVRNGVLHIFVPPTKLIEHYLELIFAIETIAHRMQISVVIEGYAPPKDLRIGHFSVTPDPGVIEINIQPSSSWDELKHITTTVYDEARHARLTAEKFMLDGRRVGTGGGNHIVIGGATPDDSPFLRRPDLLRSMIAFWQNHPALSYLFSSMYIGPTSQAPRIDEARHDSLYELEIAFNQTPDNGNNNIPYWLTDRIYRNLLIDLTGNTHRAEFCIDKLYSPDRDAGRLGLLEMRGFEMSPHAQMNLLQNLLVRACIACFWKNPYRNKLVRWGTQLHDKFMLSYYIRQDLYDAIDYLNSYGYDFRYNWFEPFFDFRFPIYGQTMVGNIGLELRYALEPWNVMGEESNGGGVSRSVDSSVERLEIKVTNLYSNRHKITCNGYEIPLQPTRFQGIFVAGIRYKAWSPHSSLHPSIQPHVPLVFDIFDKDLGRSIGGCTYHVAHPGGRGYDIYPVNENEAQGRRLSRFQCGGHTAGYTPINGTQIHPDFPNTLDLRLNTPIYF
jgi:uncharacterized protein (DUF2126 family)/transglutaminase-like putative cysteine protease